MRRHAATPEMAHWEDLRREQRLSWKWLRIVFTCKTSRIWSHLGATHGGVLNVEQVGIVSVHGHMTAKGWPASTPNASREQSSSTPVM